MTNYNLADLVVRIKVAFKARLISIKVIKTKLNINFLYLLYKIGLLRSFHILQQEILVYLKYKKDGRSLINDISIVSKPSKRVYWNLTMLSKKYRQHAFSSFYIISTSRGLMTSNDALLSKNISGEVLCRIKI
jgi:small subunit ribosomal protein S8